jgi:hypothetical protein
VGEKVADHLSKGELRQVVGLANLVGTKRVEMYAGMD